MIPRYPHRQQVVDYLEDYKKQFNINPVFNTAALSVKKEGDYWITETTEGSFKSKYIIMATGLYGKPKPIMFKGMETFAGKILHSIEYKTGKDFKGQNVLVTGFGNSACEIAIDLYEQGAAPSMAVRSAVNVIPRDVFGIPVVELSLLMSRLPPRVADTIIAPFMKWLIGDITNLGLKKSSYGPMEQIHRDGKAPLLDIGTVRHIRQGNIKIYDDIDQIDGKIVHFKSGKKAAFDTIVAAIGYCSDYDKIVEVDKTRFRDLQECADKQKYFGKDGLFFCGYSVSPTGQIREIASDAKKIATHIAKKESVST